MSYLILLFLGTTVANDVQYNIRPSQSQYYCDQCSNSSSMNNSLTLSQFVDNSIDYLTEDTRLLFSLGNYNLESEFIIENVHSFSIFGWPSIASKAIMVCDHVARFEFRNVSIITVSGLEFVGCFNNLVISVGRFKLEDSIFFGDDQAIVSGTVLMIESSTADLDRVAFVSIAPVDKRLPPSQEFFHNFTEYCTALQKIAITDKDIGISSNRSIIRIAQSWFEGNNIINGGIIYDKFGSDITIVNTTFVNNRATSISNLCSWCQCTIPPFTGIPTSALVFASNDSTIQIYNSIFVANDGIIIYGDNSNIFITHTKFIINRNVLDTQRTNLIISYSTFTDNIKFHITLRSWNSNGNTSISISYCEFVGSDVYILATAINDGIVARLIIDHNKFMNNNITLYAINTKMVSISHSEFVNNTAAVIRSDRITLDMESAFLDRVVGRITSGSLIILNGIMMTISQNQFINNRAISAIVFLPYFTSTKNLTNNEFHENSAAYEVFVSSTCRPGLSLSLGNFRCIQCGENWHQNLIGIVIAAFIAGIGLVILMLALNMTVAVGTLNGILFYANIVAANTETYFFPFETPSFVTVFISWLNLDIGFDVCFLDGNEFGLIEQVYKALIQLAFPIYVIFIVIFVIVASEHSSKFAKIIGKGNPVAVLATMILLSYTKFLNAIHESVTLLYSQPAFGSRNVDITRVEGVVTSIERNSDISVKTSSYVLLFVSILIFLLCFIYSALIFSWQWLLQYQDKVIFKWVRYQKLRHFLEPYHAPHTTNYRYWTGLLLFVRTFLYIISVLNLSLDPRIDLLSTLFIVGGLILLKGVMAKRIYKNWLLDIMETAIFFNVIIFSAFSWYNIEFGGNQVAAAYTSVMIIFILFLLVIVFHVLFFTGLYKWSFFEKAIKLISSKQQEPQNDDPKEQDDFRIERLVTGNQGVTCSTVEIH